MSLRDEVAAFNARFSAALALPDHEQLMNCYTEDAVFLSTGRPTTVGRNAIGERLRHSFTEPVNLTFECGQILEDGDIVVDIGTIIHDGDASGRYVVLYRREDDGSLKLAVDVPLSL